METKLVVFKSKENRRTLCKNDQSIPWPTAEMESSKMVEGAKCSNVEQ